MSSSRPAAERVRPILQAMERSISAARNRRLHATGHPSEAVVPAAHDPGGPDPESSDPPPVQGDRPPARLKARPKRSTGFATFPARPAG